MCRQRCRQQVAEGLGALTMAFPALSTGIYGYPRRAASEVAVSTLRSLDTTVRRIVLVAFDAETHALYRRLLT